MIELAQSKLSNLLELPTDPDEGIYPMNDDIILLQPLVEPVQASKENKDISVAYGIDGTENNLYAVPFGLTRESDPITYDVLRGSTGEMNSQETLENVPFDTLSDYNQIF